MTRPVVPREPTVYLNGVYHDSSFRKRHRTLAMDIGSVAFGVVAMLIGILMGLVVVFGLIWVVVWLGEAVLRRFS